MKLQIESRDLKDALHRLAAAPTMRAMAAPTVIFSADPFGGLKLKRNTLASTMRLECKALVEEGGEIAVNFERLAITVARWGVVTVDLESDGKKLTFKAGTATGSLVGLPTSEVEKDLSPLTGCADNSLIFDSQAFREALRATMPAMLNEAGRECLRGIVLRTCGGRLTMLATDGRRFHACFLGEAFEYVLPDPERAFDPGMMVDKATAIAINRLIGEEGGNVTIRVGENGGTAEAAGRYLRFLTCAECPPDVLGSFKKLEPEITISAERARLLELVKTAASLGDGSGKAITVHMGGNMVTVEAVDSTGNVARDFLPGSSSRACSFRVNGAYFSDLLDAASGEQVELEYVREFHSIVLREPDRLCMLQLLRDQTGIKP